jgi:hypothetical protein
VATFRPKRFSGGLSVALTAMSDSPRAKFNELFPTVTSTLIEGLFALNEAIIGVRKYKRRKSLVVIRKSPTWPWT